MKVKENFNMDLCHEILNKNFPSCEIKKGKGIMGEYIDVKKSFSVGSRVIYIEKNKKLNIGSRPTALSGLFGVLFSLSSMDFVNEVKNKLNSEFGLDS